jgi:hypothetical protein
MDAVMAEYLTEMELGDLQEYKGMSVIPLFPMVKETYDYITLKEALNAEMLVITEVDQQGAVPLLKVYNQADVPVLILDGEELVGAKQNRVLNTTILLKEKSETVIPVSCTEQGRWRYTSDKFRDSDVVAASRVRRTNISAVKESLKSTGEFRSNQGAVWNDIQELSQDAHVQSKTMAMSDVYQSREQDLDEYLEAFPVLAGQKGLLVIINGVVVGFDVVSSAAAYSLLHQKLVKSYALEALVEENEDQKNNKASSRAKTFLADIKASEEDKHESVGYGCDYRFEAPSSVGSSLIHQDQIIHTAFFNKMEMEEKNGLSSYRKRRSYRTIR